MLRRALAPLSGTWSLRGRELAQREGGALPCLFTACAQLCADCSANAVRHVKIRFRRRIAGGCPAPLSWSGVNGQRPNI